MNMYSSNWKCFFVFVWFFHKRWRPNGIFFVRSFRPSAILVWSHRTDSGHKQLHTRYIGYYNRFLCQMHFVQAILKIAVRRLNPVGYFCLCIKWHPLLSISYAVCDWNRRLENSRNSQPTRTVRCFWCWFGQISINWCHYFVFIVETTGNNWVYCTQ